MKIFNEIISGELESDAYVPIELCFSYNKSPTQKLLHYSCISNVNVLFLELLIKSENKKLVKIILTSQLIL